jgi:glutamine phosphoribosylpyrophosphate amidotransferase
VQNSEKMGLEKAVQQVIEEIKGAFSVIMMNGKNMVAFRDKWGIRPLYFGKFEKNSF